MVGVTCRVKWYERITRSRELSRIFRLLRANRLLPFFPSPLGTLSCTTGERERESSTFALSIFRPCLRVQVANLAVCLSIADVEFFTNAQIARSRGNKRWARIKKRVARSCTFFWKVKLYLDESGEVNFRKQHLRFNF